MSTGKLQARPLAPSFRPGKWLLPPAGLTAHSQAREEQIAKNRRMIEERKLRPGVMVEIKLQPNQEVRHRGKISSVKDDGTLVVCGWTYPVAPHTAYRTTTRYHKKG